jgi:hypothetical protein
MRQLLDSDLEVAVQGGFLYLPLLRDPTVEREIGERTSPASASSGSGLQDPGTIIASRGRYFVRTLSLQSLVRSYEKIDPAGYGEVAAGCLKKYHLTPNLEALAPEGKLLTILFGVMPYFIRKNRGFKRQALTEPEILELVSSKVETPAKYCEEARGFLDSEALRAKLAELEGGSPVLQPPVGGLMRAHELREWLHGALHREILAREKERLTLALQVRERLGFAGARHMCTLLYLAEKGWWEIDGFGFSRISAPRDEYLIFKRTDKYVLKDYYGRSYLFPPCRVGVSTVGPLRPIVVDTYKHPFLFDHAPGQEICLMEYNPPGDFTAGNIIKVLEDGLNALLYGYDARRGNGYHSLDRTREYVKTIEFDDYRI